MAVLHDVDETTSESEKFNKTVEGCLARQRKSANVRFVDIEGNLNKKYQWIKDEEVTLY